MAFDLAAHGEAVAGRLMRKPIGGLLR